MKSYLLFCLILCILRQAMAQTQISGLVNAASKPLGSASVLLLNPADSSLVKGTTTNNIGSFTFSKITAGNYLVVISSTGFSDSYITASLLQDQPLDMGIITLMPESKELNDVVVTAKKPMFEQKIDRMVINVKNSITSAGGTVLDVLEKSPGVVVNRSSGSVALNGKDGVMVMINGKMTYMPKDALLQMLNGINASNVEKIELITTPPAKYDAGGNAGFINIVLLSNPDEGFNGSYALSGGISSGSVLSANTNFNYRKKNVNLYGTCSYSRDAQLQQWNNHRAVVYKGDKYVNDITSRRDPFTANNNVRLGLDYNAGKKTVIGVLIGGYDLKWQMEAVNNTTYTINGLPDTSLVINNQEINHWKNAMSNLNLQHTFNEGKVLSFNADYLYYKDNNPTSYENVYYNKDGAYLFAARTSSTKETIIKIFASQLDYSHKMNDKVNFEMGAKVALSKFSNDVLVQKENGGIWEPDPGFTAIYFLKEHIYAAYFSTDSRLGGRTNIKAGLRYEYTTSNLGSETKTIVDRKYGQLFPTLNISHKINVNHSVNFSYNRRINRPGFTQLAPFVIFLDPKTFVTGNPALQPAITDAIKLDYLYKHLVFSVSYSYEKNYIADFQSKLDSTNNSEIQTTLNLPKSQLLYFSSTIPIKITSRWNSQINVSVNWNTISTNVYKEPVKVSEVYYAISGSESFAMPGNFSAEISGTFQSGGLIGAYKASPYGTLDAGVKRKFPKLSASLIFGVDNILNSMILKASQNIPALNLESSNYFQFSQRLFKLTWTQNFGNKALKDNRSHATASEDERKRVK
jgi:hypothetical protein